MTVTTLHTAEELYQMPEDGYRYELVEGELFKMSPSGLQHGWITARVARHIGNHVAAHGLGEVYIAEAGFVLKRGPDTVRCPDVAFLRTERVIDTPAFAPFAPDLAIEVVSPSDRASEIHFKISQYLRYGTRAVIVIDPQKHAAYVHRASGSDIVTKTAEMVLEVEDVVPGWAMPLSEIFDR